MELYLDTLDGMDGRKNGAGDENDEERHVIGKMGGKAMLLFQIHTYAKEGT